MSHWAIPEIIVSSLESYLGLNSKVLVILTDIKNIKLHVAKELRSKDKSENPSYLFETFKGATIFKSENSRITSLIQVDKSEIFGDENDFSLDLIRSRISRKFGYISAVISIDMLLVKQMFDNYFLNLSKFNPRSKIKTFKMFKKPYYFNIYPEIPIFKLINNQGIYSLFRTSLPIFIDKHEF